MPDARTSFSLSHPENALHQCVSLSLDSPRQGSTLDRFSLSFDLACGTQPIEPGLQIGLQQCRIMLRLDECVIERGSAYNFDYQKGGIEQIETGSFSREHSITGEAKAEAGAGLLSGFVASIKAAASASGTRHRKDGRERKVTPRIPLISFEAGSCWVVGADGEGDVKNPGGLLRGQYFNEVKDGDGSPLPACWLRATEGAKVVAVTVGVVVRMGDLKVVESNTQVGDDMAERIAGMVVLKKYKRHAQKIAAVLHPEQITVSIGHIRGCVEHGGDHEE